MIWNSIGNFAYLFTQWLTTYLVTKILGFENAGVFSLAMSLCASFYTIASYGMRTYQASDTSKEHKETTYIYSRILTSVLSFIVCMIFIFSNPYNLYQRTTILIYMVFKVTEAMIDVYHGIDQLNMRMDLIGKSFLLRSLINSILFIVTIILTKNLVLGLLIMCLSSFIVQIAYDQKKTRQFYVKEQVEFNLIKKLLIISFPIMIYTFMFTTFTSIPKYYIEKVCGSNALGIYASISLPVIIVQVLATYIFAPFVTVFANQINNKDFQSFKKLFLKITLALVMLSIIAIVGSKILGEFGLKLLFGKEIEQYINLLIPLVWCTIVTAYSWFLTTIVTVIRNFKILLLSGTVATLFCLIFSKRFVVKFDLNGASYITIVSYLIQIAFMLTYICYYLRKHKS